MSHPAGRHPVFGAAASGDAQRLPLRRLLDASVSLHACREADEVLRAGAWSTVDATGALGAAVVASEPGGHRIRGVATVGSLPDSTTEVARDVLRAGRPVHIPGEDVLAPVLVGAPVRTRGRVLGAVVALLRVPLSQSGEAVIAELGRIIGSALESATAHQRAREASLLRDALMRHAAHELRGPLTVASANLELVEDGLPESTTERDELLRRVRSAIDAMSLIADDVLGYHRLAEDAVVTRRIFDLGTAARAVADKAGTRVRYLASVGELPVRADERLVVDALSNLVDNALKHTPDHGQVTVAAGARGRYGCVSVSDEGPGIPRNERERVFQPFVRLDGAAGALGSGLGLSIVKMVAAAHGGSVSVDQAEAGGAVFTMRLPLESGADAQDVSAQGSRYRQAG